MQKGSGEDAALKRWLEILLWVGLVKEAAQILNESDWEWDDIAADSLGYDGESR